MKIEIEQHFDATPDQLWQIVGDVARTDWVPSVTESRLDTDVRTMVMAGAGVVRERIFLLDESSRRVEYGVIASAAPLEHHRAILQVVVAEPGCCLVWSTEVEPEAFAPFIRQGMEAAVAQLKLLLR
jgi:hypothetical protein